MVVQGGGRCQRLTGAVAGESAYNRWRELSSVAAISVTPSWDRPVSRDSRSCVSKFNELGVI